jgi:hypothetical protein
MYEGNAWEQHLAVEGVGASDCRDHQSRQRKPQIAKLVLRGVTAPAGHEAAGERLRFKVLGD